MANPEHLEILKQGVKEWNRWRSEHPDVIPDFAGARLGAKSLGGANLRNADVGGAHLFDAYLIDADLSKATLLRARLDGADLSAANLSEADLGRAVLLEANLQEANCIGASFREANLRSANLCEADLREASLHSAVLAETNLCGAILGRTDFSHALVLGTHFADLDLTGAQGLEAVEHHGPSTVGIDTIYKSRGKIPEIFLRGCGVPDEFIAYISSMVGRPVEFYSCFISYSTNDQEFAERLHADLQAKGVRCWFAPHDIKGGRKLHEQIDEAIRLHDKLLLILSEHSMSSEWVKTEIAKARKREMKEGKRVLFPVRLVEFEVLRDWECFDADTGKDSAREIREYFIPDFSNWKDHDSYQTAFQRLVKDLKAGASK